MVGTELHVHVKTAVSLFNIFIIHVHVRVVADNESEQTRALDKSEGLENTRSGENHEKMKPHHFHKIPPFLRF